MRKPKQPNISPKPTLKDFLDSYDTQSLYGALNSIENSLGWELFKAYGYFVQRQYEVNALDMIGKEERDPRAAAFASGYAKGVQDLLETFLPGLNQVVLGRSHAVENPPPQE